MESDRCLKILQERPLGPMTIMSETDPKKDECLLNTMLPPEIRNYIFELTVVEAEPIELEFESVYSTNDSLRHLYDFIRRSKSQYYPTGLALSRTCRQFCGEAMSLFYSENTFAVVNEPKWSGTCSTKPLPEALRRIKSIVISFSVVPLKLPEHWNVGKITLSEAKDRTLNVHTTNHFKGMCICAINSLVREHSGEGCVAEAFDKLDEELAGLYFSNTRLRFRCGTCGQKRWRRRGCKSAYLNPDYESFQFQL